MESQPQNGQPPGPHNLDRKRGPHNLDQKLDRQSLNRQHTQRNLDRKHGPHNLDPRRDPSSRGQKLGPHRSLRNPVQNRDRHRNLDQKLDLRRSPGPNRGPPRNLVRNRGQLRNPVRNLDLSHIHRRGSNPDPLRIVRNLTPHRNVSNRRAVAQANEPYHQNHGMKQPPVAQPFHWSGERLYAAAAHSAEFLARL